MIPFVVGAMLLQTVQAKPQPIALATPFGVGETLEYGGKWSGYPFGEVAKATMKIAAIDTVRGVPQWHFSMTTRISALVFHNHTELESWTTVGDFNSHRYIHKVNEQGKQLADDDFQIFGDSGYYRNRNDTLKKRTPPNPLDDVSFIYYLRTMAFKKDSTYKIPRYFRDDHNPVEVTVIGHDTLEMPDGSRRSCWVIHPVVDEPNGMFARKANARIWLSDDGVRIPVQIVSDLVIGHVTLKLKSITHSQ